MFPDSVVISFNGQIDFGTAVAFLSLALTLLQWIVTLIRGRRAAAEPGLGHLCPCGQDARGGDGHGWQVQG